MLKTNVKLLSAIREKGFRQVDFAKAIGEHHTIVSRVINGWVNLSEAQKIKYAEALGKKTTELFED